MRKMAYANLFQNLPDMFFRCKENGILEEWRSKLAMRDLIERVAERLFELKQTVSI